VEQPDWVVTVANEWAAQARFSEQLEVAVLIRAAEWTPAPTRTIIVKPGAFGHIGGTGIRSLRRCESRPPFKGSTL
jgi:hypothetical protein